MVNVIHVFGASGSGTTTIGRAIAERYGYAHLDADDFYWLPSDPPYMEKREPDERLRLLARTVANCGGRFVLSGSLCGWGDSVIETFDLALFVYTRPSLRLARLMTRERLRFGRRVSPGGDMHETHMEFLRWAKRYDKGGTDMRSLALHEEWIKKLPCRVAVVDGATELANIVESVGDLL